MKLIVYRAVERPKKGFYRGPLWIPQTINVDIDTEAELMYEIRSRFGPGDYRISLPPNRYKRRFRPMCRCSIFDHGWIRSEGNVSRLKPTNPVGDFHHF